MKHRTADPEITASSATLRALEGGLLDGELEKVERALLRRRKQLGQAKLWFTSEQNARLCFLCNAFGLIVGVTAGLITGFGYAGGFR